MFKLIIVDDEKIIRDSLLNFFDWESMGFEVIACLKDGSEVIDLLSKTLPDVILADINMKLVGGIELAKYIFEKKLPIILLLISGYKDFDYARQAIMYSVKHYLLKPISLEEVKNVFGSLVVELEQMQNSESQKVLNQNKLKLIKYSALRTLFEMFGIGLYSNKNELLCYLERFHLEEEVKGLYYLLTVKCIEKNKDFLLDGELLLSIVEMVFKDENLLGIYSININEDSLDLALQTKNIISNIQYLSVVLRENVKLICNVDIEIDYSYEYQDVFLFSNFYNQEYFHNRNMANNENKSYLDSIITQFLHILNASERFSDAESALYNIYKKMFVIEGNNFNQDNVIKLFSALAEKLPNEKASEKLILAIENLKVKFNDYNEMQLLSLLLEITYNILKESTTNEGDIIKKIKNIIQQNPSENYSLSYLSSILYLNSSYLSRTFKEKTGENFSDYIIRQKVEKACEYLKKPDYKVYEIAQMLSYKDIRHFYKVFKKVTSYTPTEYRSLFLRNV